MSSNSASLAFNSAAVLQGDTSFTRKPESLGEQSSDVESLLGGAAHRAAGLTHAVAPRFQLV